MRKFLNTLRIPEATVGGFKIEHRVTPAGHTLLTSNERTMVIGGQPQETIIYDFPTTWRHLLSEDDRLWMSDLPIEQAQHRACLKPVTSGDVLVGGLGLGLAVSILARRSRVNITVIERSAEVISLVQPFLPKNGRIKVVHADLFEYLRGCSRIFRWAFYDIWQADSEHVFFGTVAPLHTLSKGIVCEEPICWNEDVMRGQLMYSLITRSSGARQFKDMKGMLSLEQLSEETDDMWLSWSVPFFRWVLATDPDEERLNRGMQAYAGLWGRWNWKQRWEETI